MPVKTISATHYAVEVPHGGGFAELVAIQGQLSEKRFSVGDRSQRLQAIDYRWQFPAAEFCGDPAEAIERARLNRVTAIKAAYRAVRRAYAKHNALESLAVVPLDAPDMPELS